VISVKGLGLAVCLLCLFVWAPMFAEGGKATISGHVTDSAGGVLQGAEVTLTPKGGNAVTDNEGNYAIVGLASGDYTVNVNYVGFAVFTKSITVAEGQVVHLDARLDVAAQSAEILVTAERPRGEAEQINRQRTADNIVQVLSAEVITSLPNANIADALGRLPSVTLERDEGEGKYVQIRGTEPRLSNTTIDGVNVPSPETGVRQVKLDTLASDLVESVEINKTLQANMDGDGVRRDQRRAAGGVGESRCPTLWRCDRVRRGALGRAVDLGVVDPPHDDRRGHSDHRRIPAAPVRGLTRARPRAPGLWCFRPPLQPVCRQRTSRQIAAAGTPAVN
jgi:hypothetical protein